MSQNKAVSIRARGDVSIIEVPGDVTAAAGEPIEDAYRQASLAGARKLLFRFDEASYINSGGIAVLIGIVSESSKKGQTVRMTGLSSHFQKIFAMVGLTRYAQVFPSEDTALETF
jgi:anti-anti-sigma factor